MTEQLYTHNDLVTFAESVNRMLLARALGQTAYGGERDYYKTLGYPDSITFDDYLTRYERQDIAGRLVDLPATDTWKKPPAVSEDDDTDTPFVLAWGAMLKRLRVWSALSRADKLSGIGQYGVLLIGVRDGEDLSQPVMQGSLKNERDILYLRPFSEGKTAIATWDNSTASERYGLPELYSIKLRDDQGEQKVHWTRIIHLAENKLDSEVYGVPRLQRVYNRLDDLMKLVGGSAEATWLGMRPGTMLTNREGYQLPQDDDSKADREAEVKRYAHDPLRFLMMEGIEAKQIGPGEVTDISGPFGVALSLVAAASGIPQRVLVGSAQGELAAAEYDAKQWAGEITYRQGSYAEPEILRPFINRMIWYGVLPAPADDYAVGTLAADGMRYWPSLIAMDEGEWATITRERAQAVRLLAHPITGEMPVTIEEQRELLGYPAEEQPEEEPEAEPEEEPEAVAANAGTVEAAIACAMANYRAGTIDADTLAAYAIAEWAEATEQ